MMVAGCNVGSDHCLAQQHFENLMRRVGFSGEHRSAQPVCQRNDATANPAGLASGRIDMVVRTHRLLSADVR